MQPPRIVIAIGLFATTACAHSASRSSPDSSSPSKLEPVASTLSTQSHANLLMPGTREDAVLGDVPECQYSDESTCTVVNDPSDARMLAEWIRKYSSESRTYRFVDGFIDSAVLRIEVADVSDEVAIQFSQDAKAVAQTMGSHLREQSRGPELTWPSVLQGSEDYEPLVMSSRQWTAENGSTWIWHLVGSNGHHPVIWFEVLAQHARTDGS